MSLRPGMGLGLLAGYQKEPGGLYKIFKGLLSMQKTRVFANCFQSLKISSQIYYTEIKMALYILLNAYNRAVSFWVPRKKKMRPTDLIVPYECQH